MPSNDTAMLSATDLVRQFRRRSLSPVEVARACLERIERWNETVGAFCFVDREGALAAAAASEARWANGEPSGPLDGVPATVKDLVFTRGWTLRRGSHTTAGHPPAAEDAPATARLREAGAVLLGSTTTPEFGWKAVTDNPLGHLASTPGT
jgi:aspartyl-tRNA(Asn)/glutamyl-tRNA(Gln) amidotransferase subunit A